MRKIIVSSLGVAALLMALTLNLRHSLNDYGLLDNICIRAFADGTSGPGDSTTDMGKKKFYKLAPTGAACTLTKTSTTTRVTTSPIGSETVTEQTTMQVTGKYFKCEETSEADGSRSCSEGCYI